MADLYGINEEIEMIPPNEFICRNPQIVTAADIWNLQVDFILFYESNETGNFDLYYVTYDEGSSSEPNLLSDTITEDINPAFFIG